MMRDAGWRAEVVLFIHGTGSQAQSSDFAHDRPGEQRWYQRGSPFWREFDALLRSQSAQARLPEPDFWREFAEPVRGRRYDHFYWSGANSEQHRREAGLRLYRAVAKMAQRGVGVHLIGHSHGGSVIRHALTRGRLDNVLSVSSLGTPFIDHGPAPWGWWWLVAAVVVLLLATEPLWRIVQSVREFTAYPERSYNWKVDLDVAWLTEFGRRWTEAIAQEHSPATYVTLPCALLLAGAFLAGYGRFVWRRFFSAFWRQWRAAPVDFYRQRWNVLFSRHDEAINALILVDRLRLEGLAPRFGNLFWLYDRLAAPLIEQFVSEISRGGALGADVAGEFVTGVSRFPFEPVPVRPLFVERIDRDLLARADELAQRTVVALRRSLSDQAAHPGPLFSNRDFIGLAIERVISSTNGELVHNQYFDDIGVQSELVRHIVAPLAERGGESEPPPPPAERSGYRRLRVAAVLGGVLLAGISLASSLALDQHVNQEQAVRVASKAGDEWELLGEILAAKLRQGGFPRARYDYTDYSTREILQRAAADEVHVYAELTGSLYNRLLDPAKINPLERRLQLLGEEQRLDRAPWLEALPGERSFHEWFAERRRKEAVLAKAVAGEGLGLGDPYVLVIRAPPLAAGKVGARSLYTQLAEAGVLEPLAPECSAYWRRNCPQLAVQAQFNFQKFRAWYGGTGAMQVRVGLSPDAGYRNSPLAELFASVEPGAGAAIVSSLSRIARQGLEGALLGNVQVQRIDDGGEFAQLLAGKVDLVVGSGLAPELYQQEALVPLALAGFGSWTPRSDTEEPPQPIDERRHVTDFLLPYQGAPLVFHRRRAQRQALVQALAAPPSPGVSGRLSQERFAQLLAEFRRLPLDKLTPEQRAAAREELVARHWETLFVPSLDFQPAAR